MADLSAFDGEDGIEFYVFEDKAGEWRWHGKTRNGRIVVEGAEGYVSESNARRALWNVVGAIDDLLWSLPSGGSRARFNEKVHTRGAWMSTPDVTPTPRVMTDQCPKCGLRCGTVTRLIAHLRGHR